MMNYTHESVKALFMELLCITGTAMADPMLRQANRRTFFIVDEGEPDGEEGFS